MLLKRSSLRLCLKNWWVLRADLNGAMEEECRRESSRLFQSNAYVCNCFLIFFFFSVSRHLLRGDVEWRGMIGKACLCQNKRLC